MMRPYEATAGFPTDRRTLFKLGTLGIGALGLQSVPGAAQVLAARGFTHGVASGEPAATSVLLWTRYVAANDTRLTVELSPAADFHVVTDAGEMVASAERDHCAKITVSGLAPDRWYYYRFVAPDGTRSCVGRTRTLPQGHSDRFTLAVFSCANMGFGWFHAYADAARRSDIDLAVHLGDYLYEYAPGVYPEAADTVADRTIAPLTETLLLADYRLRHAAYRADPALQRLHQVVPMIMMWDDHELANDAWMDGAQNHSPATEGDWRARKAAALQAYREWLPVSDTPYRSYDIGDLATIILPETRVTGRMEQLDLSTVLRGQADIAAALTQFRDRDWQNPNRSMLGATQFGWLTGQLRASVARGTKWQVIAQQVLTGTLNAAPDTLAWVPANASAFVRGRFAIAAAAGRAGLPLNFDAWDGYPAERARLLGAAQSAGANLVTLAGDSHNGWAFDLTHDNRAAGVDFGVQSVTSTGFEAYTAISESDRVAALRASSPGLRWANTDSRGYMTVELTPAAATTRYRLMRDVRTTAAPVTIDHSLSVAHGTNRIADG